MIAMQALVGARDEVVAVTPVWPNLTAQPAILGATVVPLPLSPEHGAWRLDLQRLLDTVTSHTRVLLVNAPNNPTGWTLSRSEQQAILDHCRRTGTWIVADEVYERLWFGEGADAPSSGEARPAAAVEHVDAGRVADAVERPVERHGVVHAELADLLLGHRRGDVEVGHQKP